MDDSEFQNSNSENQQIPQRRLEMVTIDGGPRLGTLATSNPVAAYLTGLCNPSTRRTMYSTLQSLARALGVADIGLIDWSNLRYEHVPLIKNAINQMPWGLSQKKRCLVALRQVAREAWLLKEIEFEVYEGVRAQKTFKGSELPRGRYVDYGQVMALYRATGASMIGFRDRAMLSLLFGCGLRRSEACHATVESLADGFIMVKGKGNRERRVPFAERALDHVQEWLRRSGVATGYILRKFSFGNRKKGARKSEGMVLQGKLSGEGVRTRVIYLCRQAGIPEVKPHDARRTFATNLIQAGVDLHVVKEILGHASINTTLVYDKTVENRMTVAGGMVSVPGWNEEGNDSDKPK